MINENIEVTEHVVLTVIVQNNDRDGHCEAIFVIDMRRDSIKKVTDVDMFE